MKKQPGPHYDDYRSFPPKARMILLTSAPLNLKMIAHESHFLIARICCFSI